MSVLLATAMNTAAAAWKWVVAKNMCGGIIDPCTSAEECTTVAYGPCEGDASSPTAYLKSHAVGMAFVDLDKYLACADPNSCNDMKVLSPTGLGYRDFSGAKTTTDGGKYAYSMTGNMFGANNAGGYAGIASYINNGDKNIESPTNVVYVSDNTARARIQRDDSMLGAPNGPYQLCITDTSSTSGSCTNKATYKPGDYKFSIFGYTIGSDYATQVVAGSNGFPAGMDFLGVRMKLQAVGFKVNDVKVNGKKFSEHDINSEVNSLSLMHASGGINIDFPKKYNTGPTSASTTTTFTVSATKDVKIRVHGVDGASQSLYIDYLFETAGMTAANKYFMYDPTVTEVKSNDLKSSAAALSVYLVGSVAAILSTLLL